MTTKKRTTKQKLSWYFGGMKGNLGMAHSQIKAMQKTVYYSLGLTSSRFRSVQTRTKYPSLNKRLGALTLELIAIEKELNEFQTLLMQDVELEHRAKLLEEQQDAKEN